MNTMDSLRTCAAFGASVAAAMLVQFSPVQADEVGAEERAAFGGASVRLPGKVIQSAGAYSQYMRTAAGISPRFTDGESVAKSVRTGASFEAKQLAQGAIAFAAVVALEDRSFAAGVRQAAERAGGEREFAALLKGNPYYSGTVPGAARAAASASRALATEGERVRTAGLRVKMAAYDVQRQDWSKAEVSGRTARLAEAKALSAKPLRADENDVAMALAALDDRSPIRTPVAMQQPKMTPVVARGLALAALAVLGEAGDAEAVEQMMTDPECGTCLRMSKLNLFQCLAVAKPWYEDVFCLGQHVLIDTGECVYAASGRPKSALQALAVFMPRRPEDGLVQLADAATAGAS